MSRQIAANGGFARRARCASRDAWSCRVAGVWLVLLACKRFDGSVSSVVSAAWWALLAHLLASLASPRGLAPGAWATSLLLASSPPCVAALAGPTRDAAHVLALTAHAALTRHVGRRGRLALSFFAATLLWSAGAWRDGCLALPWAAVALPLLMTAPPRWLARGPQASAALVLLRPLACGSPPHLFAAALLPVAGLVVACAPAALITMAMRRADVQPARHAGWRATLTSGPSGALSLACGLTLLEASCGGDGPRLWAAGALYGCLWLGEWAAPPAQHLSRPSRFGFARGRRVCFETAHVSP